MTSLPFSIKSPENSPGFLLWQTTTLWHKNVKNVLDPHNVTHTQFVLMALVLWCGANGYTPNQRLLCELSALDKMTVSKALTGLEGMAFLTRTQNQEDTRANVISLTQEGETLVRTLVPLVEGVDEAFFGEISRWDMRDVMRVLRKLTGNEE